MELLAPQKNLLHRKHSYYIVAEFLRQLQIIGALYSQSLHSNNNILYCLILHLHKQTYRQ